MAPLRFPLALLLAAAAWPAAAQRLSYQDVLNAAPRPRLAYAELEVAAVPPPPAEMNDGEDGGVSDVYVDRLEWQEQAGGDAYSWDASAMFGGPRHRLWLATAGDGLFGGGLEYLEIQALYSRPVSESGLELQAGLRRDFVPRPRRSYFALGVQGNVSEPLYLGAFAFLSHRGELTGRLFALYDLPLGPRLILQPAFEGEIAAADVPELGIGAGPVYSELGLRLRYRFGEEFAPYVGMNWERLLGRTARMAREGGDEAGTLSIVAGLRSYF